MSRIFPLVFKSLLHDGSLHLRPCKLWGWLPDEGRAFMQCKFFHMDIVCSITFLLKPLTNLSPVQDSSFQGEAWLHYPLQFMYSHIVTTFRHISFVSIDETWDLSFHATYKRPLSSFMYLPIIHKFLLFLIWVSALWRSTQHSYLCYLWQPRCQLPRCLISIRIKFLEDSFKACKIWQFHTAMSSLLER